MIAGLGRRYVKPGVLAAVVAAGMLVVWHDDIDLSPANDPAGCQSRPLRNVYRPSRLHVIDRCVTETVTVVSARRERDSDWHVNVIPDHDGLVNDVNQSRQHGYLLVEFVVGDPRPKRFGAGMRLRVTGTLVEDLQHGPAAPGCRRRDWPCGGRKRGWREIHPVFAVEKIEDPGVGAAPIAPSISGEAER